MTKNGSRALIGPLDTTAAVVIIIMVYQVLQMLNRRVSLSLVVQHPKLEGLRHSCHTWSVADQDAEFRASKSWISELTRLSFHSENKIERDFDNNKPHEN